MKKILQFALVLIFITVLSACASTGNGAMKTLTQEHAAQTIVIGKSTKAEVNAAYGDAAITHFDSGYELWLYQVGYAKVVDSLPYVNLLVSSADNTRELSILFDKSGIVKRYQLWDKQ